MTTTEVQDMMNAMMRGIDKKTTVIVQIRPDPERPGVTVQLSRDKRTGTIEFTEVDLVASRTDLRTRNRLRTALKRARDKMWEEISYIFSTKVEHQKLEGSQWFRPQQHGRGRR